jgi:hypothetical protein
MGGSSAKYRAAVAMKLLVTAEKLGRDLSLVMCFSTRERSGEIPRSRCSLGMAFLVG